MREQHVINAAKILKDIHYLTVATVCEDGSPWNSPVSATFDENLTFYWGSSPESIHSRNIRNSSEVFVVVYDSTAPEGTGEGVYMKGKAEELDWEVEGALRKYSFTPTQVWINDEAKNEDGSYKYDIRAELNLSELKQKLVN